MPCHTSCSSPAAKLLQHRAGASLGSVKTQAPLLPGQPQDNPCAPAAACVSTQYPNQGLWDGRRDVQDPAAGSAAASVVCCGHAPRSRITALAFQPDADMLVCGRLCAACHV